MCHPGLLTMDESFKPYRIAAAYLWKRLESEGVPLPVLGVICGSGLSGLSETLEGKILKIKYSDIPGFPAHCTVAGHKGEVVFGMLSGVPTMCFRGRFHSYEGHDMKTVVLPVYVMRCLTVKVVMVTNAAGGLNSNYSVGNVICVSDHLAIPQLAGKVRHFSVLLFLILSAVIRIIFTTHNLHHQPYLYIFQKEPLGWAKRRRAWTSIPCYQQRLSKEPSFVCSKSCQGFKA